MNLRKSSKLAFAAGARALGAAALLGSFFSLSCHQDAPAATPAVAQAPVATTAPAAEEQFCREAGTSTETCTRAQSTLSLLSGRTCVLALQDFAVMQRKLGERRARCNELADVLCGAVGPTSESCTSVREKLLDLPSSSCQELMKNREELIADLKRQEAWKLPLSAADQARVAAAEAPSFGPADAKITVVEFSDFQCPYCARAAEVAKQLRTKYADKVRFVARQFPLSFHQNAALAAEAALAAHAQGKYWEFHDKLFANQNKLDAESLNTFAKQAGLNAKQFKAALETHAFGERVKADVALGEAVYVQGTPTWFINGQRVADATNWERISLAIDQLLEE
jgi:protein-disulfide isomerase